MNNMKLKVFALVAVLSLVFSCKKSETSETADVTPTVNNKEVSLEQDVKTLTGPNGEKITVAYFAEGTDVAVKVNKNNEGEHKLSAKGVTDNGNPLFTDLKYCRFALLEFCIRLIFCVCSQTGNTK